MTNPKPADIGLLWVGLLAGPVAWFVQLVAVYSTAAWTCDGGPAWVLHAGSLLCLLAATGGGYLAWREWHSVGGWPGGADEVAVGRVRLMTVLGVMSGALFALVIFAQWVAVLVLPCGSRVPT